MKRTILIAIISGLLPACSKDPADPASCDVFAMGLDGSHGMDIHYDKQGRIESYVPNNGVLVTFEYSKPGMIYVNWNGNYIRRY